MPFPAPAVTSSIVSAGAGLGIVGTDFIKMASAVANTGASVFSMVGTVTVTASGLAGSGSVTPGATIQGVIPNAMAAAIFAKMGSMGLVGTQAMNQATAISNGVCSGLSSLVLMGISAGVGSGAGVGKIININNVLFGSTLYANMASQGMVGSNAAQLATAIGDGICLTMNTSGFIPGVSIAGPAGTAPGAAVFPAQFI